MKRSRVLLLTVAFHFSGMAAAGIEDQCLTKKQQYFRTYVDKYRSCSSADDCVIWQSFAVNMQGISPLHSCYIYWKDFDPSPVSGVLSRLTACPYPTKPSYPVCEGGQCVEKLGTPPVNWKLSYRRAMMDAMDPSLPNVPDPACVQNIPKENLRESARSRRRVTPY